MKAWQGLGLGNFSDRFEVFFGNHVAGAVFGAAEAGAIQIVVYAVAIVVGEFFAFFDGFRGVNPDAVALDCGFAIGMAAVIEEARRIPVHAAVEVKLVVDGENVAVAAFQGFFGFFFGEFFADVFDDAFAFADVCAGESASSVNGRLFENNQRMIVGQSFLCHKLVDSWRRQISKTAGGDFERLKQFPLL